MANQSTSDGRAGDPGWLDALERAGRGRLGALARFHPLLERGHVVWHLLACLPADHQRHQDLADAVTGEVDADGQPGAGAGHWLDQDVDSRPNRAVGAPARPTSWAGRYAPAR